MSLQWPVDYWRRSHPKIPETSGTAVVRVLLLDRIEARFLLALVQWCSGFVFCFQSMMSTYQTRYEGAVRLSSVEDPRWSKPGVSTPKHDPDAPILKTFTPGNPTAGARAAADKSTPQRAPPTPQARSRLSANSSSVSSLFNQYLHVSRISFPLALD